MAWSPGDEKVGVAFDDPSEHVSHFAAIERALPCQHLEEHATKCPDIGAFVHRLAAGLLGRHVRAVPRIMPARVIAGVVIVGDIDTLDKDPAAGSVAFARPKSRTFTAPSGRTFTLAGLRSRWTIPCSCAASSASAICVATQQRVVDGNRALHQYDPQALAPRRAPSPERSHLPHVSKSVNRPDVWVIQRGEHFGFTLESGQTLRSAATDAGSTLMAT